MDNHQKDADAALGERAETKQIMDKVFKKVEKGENNEKEINEEIDEIKKQPWGAKIPFDNDDEICSYFKDEKNVEDMKEYFLEKYKGKNLTTNVISKTLSINYRIQKRWRTTTVGNTVITGIPEEFKSFCRQVFARDEKLLSKHENNIEKVLDHVAKNLNNNRSKLKATRSRQEKQLAEQNANEN